MNSNIPTNNSKTLYMEKTKNPVVSVSHISKKYCKALKQSMNYAVTDMVRHFFRVPTPTKLRKGEFWALDDINFELQKGDFLGVLGINGSGKSSLLRILSGIYPPDQGKIQVHGKLAHLISLGTGLHPLLSGIENIFLSASLRGMKRREIEEVIPKIIEFSEIQSFIKAPAYTYSSGMIARLSFSIVVHTNCDILVVDEVLSVGDQAFREKGLNYMKYLTTKLNALICVSHNLEQIRNYCNRVIILSQGKIIFDGPTKEGCDLYTHLKENPKQSPNNKTDLPIQSKVTPNQNNSKKIQNIVQETLHFKQSKRLK